MCTPAGKPRKYWFPFSQIREVNLKRNIRKENVIFPNILQVANRTIKQVSTQKCNDLLSLFPLLPSECRTFYRSLRYSSGNKDYPIDDASDED